MLLTFKLCPCCSAQSAKCLKEMIYTVEVSQSILEEMIGCFI